MSTSICALMNARCNSMVMQVGCMNWRAQVYFLCGLRANPLVSQEYRTIIWWPKNVVTKISPRSTWNESVSSYRHKERKMRREPRFLSRLAI
jgi:hypothetical protein